jgi:endonuclease-3
MAKQTSSPSPESISALRDKWRIIADRLRTLYGYPQWRQSLPPVDELVSTILSQSTSDGNRDKGFFALKDKYPSWEAVRDAPLDEVMITIRPAGLANQKAPRIQNALRVITERVGTIQLDFLATLPIDQAKAWLTSLEGIGPKTAAIILCFAFNREAFPVDRHVHRVAQRLGLIGEKVNPDAAHPILEAIVPPADYYPGHLNLIDHGRALCRPTDPACDRCPLTDLCLYYQASNHSPRLSAKKGTNSAP